MKRSWSETDEQFIRDNYGKLSYRQMSVHLGRGELAVKSRAGVLGIRRPKKWPDADNELLRRLYADTPTAEIAEIVGRKKIAVYHMANTLGLKKSEDFLNSNMSGRLNKNNAEARGGKHRFQKGQTSWNKGKKIGSHPNSAKTQFKKGNTPHNHQPVGTIVTVDGYKKIKIAEPNKWQHLHRKIWMGKHGKIPPRHVIAFIDGDPANCVIENLECVSREDWMLRHTLHNYPEDVKAQIHILGGFKRKLNSYAKKQNGRSQEHPV